MKLLELYKNLDKQKPLTAQKKEQIMTVFGTVFIIVLTLTSAFAVDARNNNLVSIMENKTQVILNG
ncbi:MAG: hypothetical protein ACI9TY_000090 [Alphaproteobacteria bacterium]|jgi:hypothetical protein